MFQKSFDNNDDGFQGFCDIGLATFNKHASCKIHVWGNQLPFFDKELPKAITTRTKLYNHFLHNKSEKNRKFYTKQRNFCVCLLRKVKKRYYETLNEKSAIVNKLFWKALKPLFSDKIVGKNKIHLAENSELIKTNLETAKILNDFFRT